MKKLTALLLAVAMLAAVMAGCAAKTPEVEKPADNDAVTENAAESAEGEDTIWRSRVSIICLWLRIAVRLILRVTKESWLVHLVMWHAIRSNSQNI